jgi:hypothetical protein
VLPLAAVQFPLAALLMTGTVVQLLNQVNIGGFLLFESECGKCTTSKYSIVKNSSRHHWKPERATCSTNRKQEVVMGDNVKQILTSQRARNGFRKVANGNWKQASGNAVCLRQKLRIGKHLE